MAANVFSIAIQGDPRSALAAFAATQAAALKTQAKVTGAFGRMRAASALMAKGVVVAGVAGLIGLAKLGDEFGKATNIIRVGTGATGKALKGLERDFKGVISDVPADFETAATAVADLNTRVELTGKPLRRLSGQFLELSRVTGTDLGGNISSVTRLFKDWGIEGEQMSPTLDKLFRASQSTGIEVSRLSQLMVQFGSPLRQLGIDFDFATAMFANFEKAGVATETLMPGIRMALKNLSGAMPSVTEELKKMGIEAGPDADVQKGLEQVFSKIKNAGSAAEANTIAFKVFGVRAGPDMAAAIREGRFELEDLTRTIVSGKDTIRSAGKDAMTFSDRWQLFKNRVAVALEPIARRLFSAMERGLTAISDPRYITAILAIGGGLLTLMAVVPVVNAVASAVKGLTVTLTFLAAHPVVLVIAAIVAIGAALYIFRDQIKDLSGRMKLFIIAVTWMVAPMIAVAFAAVAFRDELMAAFRVVRDFIVNVAVPAVVGAFTTVRDFAVDAWQTIVGAVQAVVSWFTGTFVPFWVGLWNTVRGPLQVFLTVVRNIFLGVLAVIMAPIIIAAAFITSHWSKIRTVTLTIWSAIVAYIRFAWSVMVTYIQARIAIIRVVITTAWTVIRTVTTTVWGAIAATIRFVWENMIRPVWNAIRTFIDNVLIPAFRVLRDAIRRIWGAIRDAIQAAWHFIRDQVLAPIGGWLERNVIDRFRSMREKIADIWGSIRRTASRVWDSIIGAIRRPINSIIGFINRLIGGINRVLDAIPGLDISIPELPTISGGGGSRSRAAQQRIALSGSGVPRAAAGLALGGHGPFMTNGPTVVVGEGNPRFPEFVVPTDPKHRQRAVGLTAALNDQLGLTKLPRMGIGGIIDSVGDAFGAGKEWIGDRVSDAGGFLGDIFRQALIEIYRPVNRAVKRGLNTIPNILHMRDGAQGVRETIWQWVKGADSGLPEEPAPAPGGVGMLARYVGWAGGGVERWRSTALQALRMTGSPLSWIGSLLRRMNQESGGNPNAINLWDDNARRGDPTMGLMQNIPSAYPSRVAGFPSLRGTSPFHPLGSIVASIVYANQRYGSAPRGWDRPGGYRLGGFVDKAGMAHPGELVLNRAQQVRMLQAMGPGGGGGEVTIVFEPGSIVINPRSGRGDEDGRAAADGFYKQVVKERRVLSMAKSARSH